MVRGLKQKESIMGTNDHNPRKDSKIAALTAIGVALTATGNTAGYLLLAIIIGYLLAR